MHDGIGRKGGFLYPAFPFTSFTKVTREDALAIKAYLFSLAPVDAPRQPNRLGFPFSIRQSLLVWRELFFRPGTFKPDAAASPAVNRGAYLVEGLAHCGECHSPRNALGGTETSQRLAGAEIAGWVAPNISSDPRQGIGDWSDDQLAAFLRTGVAPKGVALGPMADVVHDSLHYLTDEDVRAIIAYLRTTPAHDEPTTPVTDPTKLEGATLYLNNCAQCHQALGVGIAGAIPSLSGNAAVTAPAPNDVIMAILGGLAGNGSYGSMPSFAAVLDDREVAAVANYVRTAWANQSAANATPAFVASLRGESTVSSPGTEAAVGFGCPKIPVTTGTATLPCRLGRVRHARWRERSHDRQSRGRNHCQASRAERRSNTHRRRPPCGLLPRRSRRHRPDIRAEEVAHRRLPPAGYRLGLPGRAAACI
jgi:mono/diheme cytochrome c family protein